MSLHTMSVLVEDKPGVLTRVAGLFAARGFNIDSLAVGPTDVTGWTRAIAAPSSVPSVWLTRFAGA